MQRYFGANVWVKSMKNSAEFYTSIFDDNNSYKIFTDLKTPSEVTYIKGLGGKIIKVSRPDHKKIQKGLDKLGQDTRVDYEIVVGEDLYKTIFDNFANISNLSPVISFILIFVVTLLTSIAGQIGDLVASRLKRTYDIKDFSNIFPGHGGFLDRFDSAIFASLVLLPLFIIISSISIL